MDRADEALRLARQAVAAAPHRPEPLFHLCQLLLERSDPEASAVGQRLARFPDHAPGWCRLGETLLRAGQPQAALLAFSRAAATAPGLVAAQIGRAACLLALRRPGEAVAASANAFAMAPQSHEAAFRHGLCLREAGERQAALRAFERAVALRPGFAEGWFRLGSLRQDCRDSAGAAQAYLAALRARPDLHEAAFNLGVAWSEDGRLDQALDAYAVALRLRPESFGRIAQALVCGPMGSLWLDPGDLRRTLAARAPLFPDT